MKIAVLSDIHDSPAVKALDAVRTETPDLILMPGDLLTGHISKEARDADSRSFKEPVNAERVLKELCAVAPTYFSPGNHEFMWEDADIRFAESLGVHVLNDRYEQVNEGLFIGGLSFRQHYGIDRVKTTVPDVSWLPEFEAEKGTKILLMHEPQLWSEYISHTNIDLTVSGHAHGGQWYFFGRGVFAPGQGLFPKYSRGVYENGRLIVSAGLANTAPVPRFFNPTEMVVIELNNW